MTSSKQPPPLPKARRRRPLLVALLMGLPVIGLIGVLIPVWYRFTNDAAVKKLEARVRARGEPITLEELAVRYPPVPDQENAATLLMDLWEEQDPQFWKAFRTGERLLPQRRSASRDSTLPSVGRGAAGISRTNPVSSDSRDAMDLFVRSNRAHFAAIQEALKQRPAIRFQVQITEGIAALLPHLATIKEEAQCLRVLSLHAIELGNVEEAIETLYLTEGIAGSLRTEPFLISQLIRLAVYSMILTDLERLLSRHALDPAELARLKLLVERLAMPNALKESLVAERASSLSIFAMPDSAATAVFKTEDGSDENQPSPAATRFGMKLINLTGIISADRRYMLEAFEKAISLTETNSPKSLVEFEALFDSVGETAKRFPPKIISGLMLPALANAGRKFAAFEARRRAALVATALERYRLENQGRLPVQLRDLSPKYLERIPVDPFDGEPLRLKTLAKGFVIYSIGADRVDHFGRERPRNGQVKDFDETFYVER